VRLSFLTCHLGRRLEDALRRPTRPPRAAARLGAFHPAIVAAYEHNLRAMIRLCRAAGAQVVVATFAACDDVTAPPHEQRRRLKFVLDVMPELDVETAQRGFDLYRDVTRRVAREESLLLVDLASLMPRDLSYFTDTVHFTPDGERVLARLLAEHLTPLLASSLR
jgi:lysophospholipase L1-like esterase